MKAQGDGILQDPQIVKSAENLSRNDSQAVSKQIQP